MLQQNAAGGIGGAVRTGLSGAGGAATSSLTFNPTSAMGLTVYSSAVGGDAGANFGTPASIGAGGAGNASLSVTASGAIIATASAIGGTGGTGGAATDGCAGRCASRSCWYSRSPARQ